MFILVDCKNFFVSCERVFQPEFKTTPTVVLSSNDGCIVARSDEAKALGIPMGAPVFKVRELVKQHKVKMFSGNFSLYGDMSNRVMNILKDFCPDTQIYSIDEAFLDLRNMHISDFQKFGEEIRDKVLKWTGLPVSIGIAKTKTLAKIAARLTKKDPSLRNIKDFSVLDDKSISEILKKIEVGDVWGIGWRNTVKLNKIGVYSAYDLIHLDDTFIRKLLSVIGLRTVQELRGISCVDIGSHREVSQSILVSRSFARPVESLSELEGIASMFIERAAEKLSREKASAQFVSFFAATSKHREDYMKLFHSVGLPFLSSNSNSATFFTPDLISAVKVCVRAVFKEGTKYKRAGVILSGLIPLEKTMPTLFTGENDDFLKKKSINTLVLGIRKKYGRNKLKAASTISDLTWMPKHELSSKKYTADWNELLIVS